MASDGGVIAVPANIMINGQNKPVTGAMGRTTMYAAPPLDYVATIQVNGLADSTTASSQALKYIAQLKKIVQSTSDVKFYNEVVINKRT